MWLVATLTVVGFLAIFGIAYMLMGSHGSSAKDTAKQQVTNPTQKYIEVVGIRIVSEKGGQAVKFLVISHSGVEMTDLAANVTLWASTQRSEEDSVGTFSFTVPSLGPNESKELTVPLKTEKQASDMPEDWRNITADVQVTSPAAQ
jgi:hypothetical protein